MCMRCCITFTEVAKEKERAQILRVSLYQTNVCTKQSENS